MNKINALEELIGFYPDRVIIRVNSKKPHDETFSYKLAQKFYNNPEGLKRPIILTKQIIYDLQNSPKLNFYSMTIFYSILGDMYYIYGDFNRSMACFMRALSYNREDLASWVGLMFSLRSLEDYDSFEKIMFNLQTVHDRWLQNDSAVLTKDILSEMLSDL